MWCTYILYSTWSCALSLSLAATALVDFDALSFLLMCCVCVQLLLHLLTRIIDTHEFSFHCVIWDKRIGFTWNVCSKCMQNKMWMYLYSLIANEVKWTQTNIYTWMWIFFIFCCPHTLYTLQLLGPFVEFYREDGLLGIGTERRGILLAIGFCFPTICCGPFSRFLLMLRLWNASIYKKSKL